MSNPRTPSRVPIVLWALQAPTLLRLFQESPEWDMRVEEMGNHEGLAEGAGLRFARLGADVPDLLFVCSPDQYDAAEALQRRLHASIPVVWVAHNGFEERLVPESFRGPVLVMSANNIHAHVRTIARTVFVIRPALPQCAPFDRRTWSYARARFWTMQNRPSTRTVDSRARLRATAEAVEAAGGTLEIYGQDQPNGFLLPEQKKVLYREGVYLSSLHPCGGFGLAEHEAMVHGASIVAVAWGDAAVDWAEYPGLVSSPEELARRVAQIAHETAREQAERRRDEVNEACRLLWRFYDVGRRDAAIRKLCNALLPPFSS